MEEAFQSQTVEKQEELFSAASLKDIQDNRDAHIDDPNLLSKRELLGKFTPLSTIHAIKGKQPHLGINEKRTERKNPDDEKSMLFSHFVNMPTRNITGYAEEPTKKLAQQRACQRFLKNLFPPGTSWLEMIRIVQNEKNKL